jgi:predicted DCC family thiol-disulfide oxidoreductase YuxK
MTDTSGRQPVRGWIGYDADCGLCVNVIRRSHGVFERRGFIFIPLQNPWLATKLGLKPGEMPEEMKLLFPDGRSIGGAGCTMVMMQAVWWLAPFAWLAWFPGIRLITIAVYRWVARNRHTLGICRVPDRTGHAHHGHTAFFEMP